MKWKYFPIALPDSRANEHLWQTLSTGARDHTLSRKVLTRFPNATGSMVLIAFDSLDVGGSGLYRYATYDGGKGWLDAAGEPTPPQGDCPIGGLVEFLNTYLRSSRETIVVFENWADSRKEYLRNWRPRESRVRFF